MFPWNPLESRAWRNHVHLKDVIRVLKHDFLDAPPGSANGRDRLDYPMITHSTPPSVCNSLQFPRKEYDVAREGSNETQEILEEKP